MTRLYEQFDAEMAKRDLDTALVVGEATFGNPELAYVTRATIPRGGIFIKRRDRPPMLVVSNIDLGNARRGRVKDIRTYSDFGYEKLVERFGRERGYIMLIQALLRSAGSRGRIGVYSRSEFSRLLPAADALRRIGFKVAGEKDSSLVECLRETKDSLEISKMRKLGAKATYVVQNVVEMLRECQIASGKLKWKRETLKVGTVKSRINALLAERGLMAPEGTVLAIGPSSADPHEMGMSSTPVRAGVPIVLDLFPVELDGYWFDLTRTFVVGKASSKIKKAFQTVLEVQLNSLDLVQDGQPAREVMNSACDLFERHGFKTIRATLKGDRDAAVVGFIHSLGHGVGLSIGERPYLSLFSDDTLRTGQVVTVEPGLYHPSSGGVRIEDTVLIRKGQVENLTHLDKQLEI